MKLATRTPKKMLIDFFEAKCSTTLNNTKFGICDNPPPPSKPAYVDTNLANKANWIAIVNNPHSYEITFVAVDTCIKILKPTGEQESRCDALLKYNNGEENIVFVELKDRSSAGWASKGDSQLRITIDAFQRNHNISVYTIKAAYIANIQHPRTATNKTERMEKFRDETGVRLMIQNTIDLK
jgi:hypothetical protein